LPLGLTLPQLVPEITEPLELTLSRLYLLQFAFRAMIISLIPGSVQHFPNFSLMNVLRKSGQSLLFAMFISTVPVTY
jgi:hypothetical protein